jgi:hypothetical protein
MSFLNIGREKTAGKFRKNRKTVLFSLAIVSAVVTLGPTLAANISLNNGAPVEFGQGVSQYSACDSEIVITPLSKLVDGSPAEFKFSGLKLTGVDTTDQSDSTPGCADKAFVVTLYNQNGTALSPTITLTVLSDGTFKSEDGLVTTQNPSTTATSALFTLVAPTISAKSVYRFTFQSQAGSPCSSANFLSGWTKLYEITHYTRNGSGGIDYTSGFGIAAGDPSKVFDAANRTIHHIRYVMQATISADDYCTDISLDGWSGVTASDLQVPDGIAHNFAIQRNVTNLNISSNYPGVINGTGLLGRLEIWPGDYGQGTSGLLPSGNSGTFDYDDVYYLGQGHGSFQVHDVTNRQTVIAWNDHSNGTPSIGFGNGNNNPDWTFDTSLTPQISNWKLVIYVD